MARFPTHFNYHLLFEANMKQSNSSDWEFQRLQKSLLTGFISYFSTYKYNRRWAWTQDTAPSISELGRSLHLHQDCVTIVSSLLSGAQRNCDVEIGRDEEKMELNSSASFQSWPLLPWTISNPGSKGLCSFRTETLQLNPSFNMKTFQPLTLHINYSIT